MERLFVNVGDAVEIDGQLLYVVDNHAVRLHLHLVGLDAQLGQLGLHAYHLLGKPFVRLSLVLHKLCSLVLALGERLLKLLALFGRLGADLLQPVIEALKQS